MRYEIEFFRITKTAPAVEMVARYCGDFPSRTDAERYGLGNYHANAEAFSIYIDGIPKQTVKVPHGGA